MDDKLRSILTSIVEAQLELSAAIGDNLQSCDLSRVRSRLERTLQDLEPSTIDLLPGFREDR